MNNKTLEYYLNNSADLGERYESAEVADLHEKLLSCFGKESNLLEIGCGSGRDAAFMQKHGYKITGIDGSQGMIDMAVSCHPELEGHLLLIELPDNLTFHDSSFDGVYSIAVLMHFELTDIQLIINKIHSIIKPKGRFLFSVPLKREGLDGSGYDKEGRLFTLLPENQWVELCMSAGFKKISTSTATDGLGRLELPWLTCIVEKE